MERDEHSERQRIKNITSEVRPEEGRHHKKNRADKERNTSGQRQKRSDRSTARPRTQQMTEEARLEKRRKQIQRRKAEERRRKARRRRKIQRTIRLIIAAVVVVALVFTVNLVRNFNTGSRHDRKGLTAYNNGEYEVAIREFKEAVSYDQADADYYIHLGMAYIETQSYAEALGYFNQAEACVEDEHQTAMLNRGRGIANLYSGNYEDASSAFLAALGIQKLSAEERMDIYYYKAEADEKFGDYGAAVNDYTEIIGISDDAGARMLRGLAYEQLQNYALAETDLYAAVEKSRKSYAIYRALYHALEAQGKTEEASAVLNDALKLSGSSGEDFFNRGMIYVDQQDTISATEMLNTSYDKGFKAALLGMGELSLQQKDYEKAANFYQRFFDEADLKSMESDILAVAYNQYALCMIEKGEYKQAAEYCQSGLLLRDRNTEASLLFNLMSAYEHLTQWDDAYTTAKEYVEKYPDDEQGQREYTFLESRVLK